jgi:3-hydroxyisobutyrate dehydrogenase-like beta-hydroxyacid dehydrogenase
MLYPPVPIGFIGTGLMGKPMAMNLIKKGYQVTVWNRTASKAADLISAGARLGKSPADAVRQASAVILMLENGAVVTELLFQQGVAAACRERTLVIDMSSIAPAIAEDHARLLARSGQRYIDAPVSGGTRGAEKATLAIMAGGEEVDLLEASPIFAAMGNLTHVGHTGGDSSASLSISALSRLRSAQLQRVSHSQKRAVLILPRFAKQSWAASAKAEYWSFTAKG